MQPHQPVLVESTLELLAPKPGERYIDATAGFGGHAQTILAKIGPNGQATFLDQDPDAIAYLKENFATNDNVVIEHSNFSEYDWQLNTADMILFDLGVSSAQLDRGERGFSFQKPAKLDMRMNPQQSLTAYQVVNDYSQADLANLIYRYGEEPRSRAIARAIVEKRTARPIETTTELATIVQTVVRTKGKTDPATKTFQAIRIEVNDELKQLQKVLPQAARALRKNGRLAVISFHSLEDRIVKRFFQAITKPELNSVTGAVQIPANYQMVTKKPVSGLTQKDNNPRSRSAKLRVVEKTN